MLKVLLSIGTLQLVTMFVLMLRTKGLALLLGPSLYGLMGVLDRMVAVFAQTAALSLPFSALRYLSPLWHSDRPSYFSLLRRMRNVLLALSLVALVVGAVLTLVAPQMLGRQIADHRVLSLLVLFGLPAVTFVPFLQNALAASFDHSRAMFFALSHALVLSVTSVLGVWIAGLAGYYALYAVAAAVLCAGAYRLIARADDGIRPETLGSERAYLPERVWRFGILLLPQAFLAPYVAYSVFARVVGAYGEINGGYMQSAMGVALAVRGVLGAAGQVFLTPLVNRPGNFEDRVARADAFQKVLFLLVGVLVAPLLLTSDVAVTVLYSREFAPAAAFVAFFVGVEVLGLAVGNYQAVLLAMDHTEASVVQNVLAQGAQYGLALLCVPRLGVAGAALAAFASQVVLMVGTAGFLAHRHGFRPDLRILLLSAYVFVMLGVCAWLSFRLPGLDLRALGVKLAVYLVLGACLGLFLDKQDWANLGRLGGELRGRVTGIAKPRV